MSNHLNKHPGGPKTPEGKARSAMNATRHGLTGATVVLRGEDPKQFQELLESYVDTFGPATPVELDLVHEIAVCRWRLQRTWTMESNLYDITLERNKAAIAAEFTTCTEDYQHALAFIKMADDSRALALLHRYETRLTRRLHQAMRDLEHLQNERKKVEQASACEIEKRACETNSPPRPLKPQIVVPPPSPDSKPDDKAPSPPRAA